MKKSLSCLVIFFVISVLLMAIMPNMIYAPPSILYVDWRNNSGTENGSETYPFNTIGEAVAVVTNGWTVKVASGIYNENLSVGLTTESVTIEGEDNSNTVINGSGGTAVLTAFHDGGGLDSDSLILRNLTITSESSATGGGISSTIARLEIYNCTITGNHTIGSGGGIHVARGTPCTVLIDGSDISNNRAESGYYGGGIYFYNGTLTITNSIVSNNNAGDYSFSSEGGGIFFSTGTLNLENCAIIGNTIKPGTGGVGTMQYNGVIVNSNLNATMNWWGSPTGPYNPNWNPGGNGNSVLGTNASLNDVYPWLTYNPFGSSSSTAESVWIRTMPLTCYRVWINEDNKFQFLFWYPYRDNNWVKIYDMSGKEVFSVDMPYDNPNLIVDLPDGMYTVKTFTVGSTEPIQTFLIGKP